MKAEIVDELWPAILLAWVAGFVDALGYLSLSHVFTAHMSGNSASLGAHLGQRNWGEVLIRGLVIPPFVVGIAIGVLADVIAERCHWRARLVSTFVLELLCLLLFVGLDRAGAAGRLTPGTPRFFILASLLTMAMGLQNATLRRAGRTKIRTTYISGMLTNMTENAVHYLLWRFQGRFKRSPVVRPDKPFGQLTVKFGLIFLSFIIGGACGGFGQTTWGTLSLLAPISGLAVLIVQDGLW